MIFFVKNCLSRRPYSDQGVDTELSWRSIAFIRCSWWRFSALSRCFHSASTALTANAPRFHCVEEAVTSPRTPCSLRANATDDHRFAQRPLCAPKELGYGDLTASPLRSIRTLSERPVTVIVLSMLKVSTVARGSMRPHPVQWRCHCVAAVILEFILRTPRCSAIF